MKTIYGLVVVCAIALAQTAVVGAWFRSSGEPKFDNFHVDDSDSAS